MLSPIDVMRGLIDQLLIWDHSYYVKNTSLVSDAVYDSVFQKLQELEKQYPEHIQPNSPTPVSYTHLTLPTRDLV